MYLAGLPVTTTAERIATPEVKVESRVAAVESPAATRTPQYAAMLFLLHFQPVMDSYTLLNKHTQNVYMTYLNVYHCLQCYHLCFLGVHGVRSYMRECIPKITLAKKQNKTKNRESHCGTHMRRTLLLEPTIHTSKSLAFNYCRAFIRKQFCILIPH